MVDEVGGLVDESLVCAVCGLDDGFYGLFTHLLCHSVHSCFEKGSGVGLLRHGLVASLDDGLEVTDEAERGGNGISPTCLGASVAGGAIGTGGYKERVFVAVCGDGNEMEIITAGLTFSPETTARTAPEGHETTFKRLVESLFVHIAEHEHLERVHVLDDCWHQSISAAAEVQILELYHILTFMFFSISRFLSSCIVISP